jgi:PAS domain S-box-containing protein
MDERTISPPNDQLRLEAERLTQSDRGSLPPEHELAEAELRGTDPEQLIAQLLEQRHELQVHQIELELQNESLAQANLDLEHARQQYTELFEHAPVGYLTLDQAGMIALCNLQAARQLGMDRARLGGRRFSAFLGRNDASSFALFLRRVFTTPGPQRVELQVQPHTPPQTPDAPAQFLQVDGEIMPHREGQPARLCRLTLTDITAQRRAQDEVLRLNTSLEARVEGRTRQLRDLNGELETMMYAVTHDLQSPLRQIRGFTQALLRNVPVGEEQQRLMTYIGQSSDQMDALLFALQEYFRAGQQRLRADAVDLDRVLRTVWREQQAALDAEREVVLTHEPLPQVRGDLVALQMVLSHLIGNAVKFTQGQHPARIHVCMKTHEQDFVVCVRDNGVGFNMRQKDRLFGVFQRLHRAEDFSGVGMGLALVRRLVHRHGGRVWSESTPNQGATFYFALPRQPDLLRDGAWLDRLPRTAAGFQ